MRLILVLFLTKGATPKTTGTYSNEEGKRIVDTIDITSFKVNGFLECRDKWGCLNVYHGREECGE